MRNFLCTATETSAFTHPLSQSVGVEVEEEKGDEDEEEDSSVSL